MDSHILIKNIYTNKRQFDDFVIPHKPMQLNKTKGIVLKTVKYGETSLIVTAYTELFGIQSYLVNGVRSSSRKGPGKANLFQPAAILDLLVTHNELKNLQRIRELAGLSSTSIYFLT